MLQEILYWILRLLIFIIQLLPVQLIALIGRFFGWFAYVIDARHRKVAIQNIHSCFPEKTDGEIKALAKENFCRIGENFACAIKTSAMPFERVKKRCEVYGHERLLVGKPQSKIVAIGHFGNFEIYARMASVLPGYQGAATFRGFDNKIINRLLTELRQESGVLFFDRRTDVKALKEAMNNQLIILGLLADQHGGDSGLILPFFGYPCSTNAAAAVLALRYKIPLFVAFCYRRRLGYWYIEVGDEIPLYQNGEARPVAEIMKDVNTAFEAAVRKDPANWFWVHNRWKADRERFLRREKLPEEV